MTYVQVSFKVIVPQNYNDVIQHYNSIKPKSSPNIQKLDRIEGGFEIPIPHTEGKDPNQRVRQVRWHKKSLRTRHADIGLSVDETHTLYQAMAHVFGSDKVQLMVGNSYF